MAISAAQRKTTLAGSDEGRFRCKTAPISVHPRLSAVCLLIPGSICGQQNLKVAIPDVDVLRGKHKP